MKFHRLALVGLALLGACGSPPGAPTPSAAPPSAVAEDPCHPNGQTFCVLNPDVTPATIRSTICVQGWTATVRPPASYTDDLKRKQIAAEHLTGSSADYEEDHRMPLELGGNPTDPQNLSPESRAPGPYSAASKDSGENQARQAVCEQNVPLRQAQADFVKKWLKPWPLYVT